MRDHSLHLLFISKRMKMRFLNGNHGSGMMRMSMCSMSILTVKVKHHARIEMINTFLSIDVYLSELFTIESKKRNENDFSSFK